MHVMSVLGRMQSNPVESYAVLTRLCQIRPPSFDGNGETAGVRCERRDRRFAKQIGVTRKRPACGLPA